MIISKKINELYNKFFKFLEGIKTKRDMKYLFTEAHLNRKQNNIDKNMDNFVRSFNKKNYKLSK